MKRLTAALVAVALLGLLSSTCMAQGVSAKDSAGTNEPPRSTEPAPYSGSFLTRSTLTGDWLGYRNELAAKGLTLDLNLTQTGQGVVGGGKETGWEYGGRGNVTLELDTQKMGWWPGGFFTVEGEGNYGDAVNFQTGSLMPVNTNELFPRPVPREFNVPEVSYTQFLSHHVGLIAGKLDTTSGDANRFAHGKGDEQFFNLAFNLNPVTLLAVPYSTLGTGAIVLPTGDPKQFVISFLALSSTGSASTAGFDTLDEGMTIASEGRFRTNFFGLTGHQLLGFLFSNKTFTSLDQNLRFIVVDRQIEPVDSSWALYYNFDQYLYEPVKGSREGIGLFGRFGASDGNPNPVHFFYSIGLGGQGVIPKRPLDRYGIGYYYIDVSNPTIQLSPIVPTTGPFEISREFLRDEQGFEAFYNFALTPYMMITPDIQVIRPAQKEALTQTGGDILPLGRKSVDTATVFGFRVKTLF